MSGQRIAKRKYLSFTTNENSDAVALTEMEFFKFNKWRYLDDFVHHYTDHVNGEAETLADWVWHWELSREDAIANHDAALDAWIAEGCN